MIGIASIAIVVLLVIWVFAVQNGRGLSLDGDIKKQSEKLSATPDIANTLTIQSQLAKLPVNHDDKNISSRIFDVLTTINPESPNDIKLTKAVINTEDKTITIDAQAENGFTALEVYKKTITATNVEYVKDNKRITIPLVDNISIGEQSYGEDASGKKVLRFSITLNYSDELFDRGIQSFTIVAPSKKNVTDSFLGVPQSLFTTKAEDIEEKK